ncbi:MAG: glycosyltransferase [Candidatus Cloacimonetes bacterium]|nr:glycosyltransferase [Candidatus Cloacimonadota bacterium]
MTKVVIIGQADFAGSAYQAASAINSIGRFNVRHISMQQHFYAFPHDVIIPCHQPSHPGVFAKDCDNNDLVKQLIKEADIIHVWNNIPNDPGHREFEESGIDIPLNKPIVITMTGSLYRKERMRLDKLIKERGWRFVIQNPMLRFPSEIKSTFIPHAVDTEHLQPLVNKDNEKVIFGGYFGNFHSLAADKTFLENHIKNKDSFVTDFKLQRIPWKQNVEIIRKCDIFWQGSEISRVVRYVGRSSLEAMAMGTPVISYVDIKGTITLSEGKLGEDIPILNTVSEQFDNHLNKLVEDRDFRIELGKKGREWIEKYFSYKVVGSLYSKIYEEVLGGII